MLRKYSTLVVMVLLLNVRLSSVQASFPDAQIVNDEGGPVVLIGKVTYTNVFFTDGVSEPLVILEDQAGFIDRDEAFLFPPESQVLAQITSDFYTSPFTYSLALPIEPQGSLRDVDQNGEANTGVMVFAVAYWNNVFGDTLLEERDQFGGGWSTAYASTRISTALASENEVVGGKYLVYAPDDQQGFPAGFGEDGLLFTADDPIVRLPQGYTVVDMDTDPFTFDRARRQVIDLIEPEGSALPDFSALSFTEAFDAMTAMMRQEYAFTDYKNVDWEALISAFRPRFETADANRDSTAYLFALRDFFWAIPDGHHRVPLIGGLAAQFQADTGGGLGFAIRELDDGRVLVNYVVEDGPADRAGIAQRAEILALNGVPIDEAISQTQPWSKPFSTPHAERWQQLRYVLRFAVGVGVTVTYQNPGDSAPQTTDLVTVNELDSFAFSSLNVGLTGIELPVEFTILDSGYGYIKVYSFDDDDRFQVLLWERMIRTMKGNSIPGIIIDLRQNRGGSPFLADQMAGYFFDEPVTVALMASYDARRAAFYADPRYADRLFLPPVELRYQGKIAVVAGLNCNSACESFIRTLTLNGRTDIVGHYPTAGLGGGQKRFIMPLTGIMQFSASRQLDTAGNILIEGMGMAPTVRVPVNEETVFAPGDVLLDAAVAHLAKP